MTQEIKVSLEDIGRAQAARQWNLVFPEPVESRFEVDIAHRRAKLLRIVIVRTVVVYNLFLIGDWLLARDAFNLALVVHFGLVTPWLLAASYMVHRSPGPAVRNLLMISVPLAMVAGVLAVFAVSRDPLASHYQYFVVIVLIYANAVLRPSFTAAVILSAVTIVAHGVICALHPTMPFEAAITSSYGLIIAAWVSLMANYYIERDVRRSFLMRLKDNLAARDLQRTADDLQRISHVDALTGLANRRGVDTRAAALFAGAEARRQPFAVLMIDVDHFKGFNDRYGHLEGDRCLSLTGGAIRSAVRGGGDIVGRYGGEEFVVILPEADMLDGVQVAERMRRAVEALAIPHDRSHAGVVTISAGVGVGRIDSPDSLSEAIAEADAALYAAKAAGRNRVHPPVPVDRHEHNVVRFG
ncbi:diguanylate cyclase [Phreatobacter sp.]|uniref:diguanylate cyclase n=1 Tax=Phreatobacter sp. TaxID=1966341 RepID=UPI003F7077AA